MKKFLILIFIVVFEQSFAQSNIPNVDLISYQNEKISISELLNKDTFYIFSFWATWCGPCLKELDGFNNLFKNGSVTNDIELLAISVDDPRTAKRVRPVVSGRDWNFDVFFDTNQKFKRSLGIPDIPATIVVYNQKIIYRNISYSSRQENEILKFINDYKNEIN